MYQRLFKTNDDWTFTFLRISLGILFLPHGLQMTFGWLGGGGWQASMNYLQGSMELPALIAYGVVLTQLLGSLFLFAGLFTRGMAFLLLIIMGGAVYTSHIDHGFFMNWTGQQSGEGFEYHLAVLAIAIPLIIHGGGKFSLDPAFARLLRSRERV
jgi:putative oxidoreductase